MNAVVVGYGSAGFRHARVLAALGCTTAIVSRRFVDHPRVYADLQTALCAVHPGYVVIANSTDQHYDTFVGLAELGFTGTVLVEKPVFHRLAAVPPNRFERVFVGYNLRFHPVIQRVRAALEGEAVLAVHAYVGQYLPEWRPATDYRRSYSAIARCGGGVLRDLSHELDYLTWLLGPWRRVTAIGGHFSDLEVDSDDLFALMFVTDRCPAVTLHMNYLDRQTRRSFIVCTARHTVEADLWRQTMAFDRDCESVPGDPDLSYRTMHESILSGREIEASSLDEGLEVVRLIEAAEEAAHQGVWVER